MTAPLPASFGVRLAPGSALADGGVLFGGDPFGIVRLSADQATALEAWRSGQPVGGEPRAGELARALVTAGLVLPLPPPLPAAPTVSVVIPVRDRPGPLARLLEAIRTHRATDPVGEIVVVDDASADARAHARIAAAAGAVLVRRNGRGRAPAARNDGAAAASGEVLAFVDSDCVPQAGWLAESLPHFGDPRVAAVAPRIVALHQRGRDGWLSRYETHRAPYDRGPHPARVVPGGRVPFVPAAALLVRASRFPGFDAALHGGEDVDLVWRLVAAGLDVRYEPAGRVAHEHRTRLAGFLARRAYYGRTAAPLARRHPGAARPLAVSPWTAAAWAALALGRPAAAAGITAASCGLLARQLDGVVDDPVRTALRLAGGGTARSLGPVSEAVVRTWWPAAALVAAAIPRLRPALGVSALLPTLLEWSRERPNLDRLRWLVARRLDDAAYGWGVWTGCVRTGAWDPLRPDLGWRLRIETGDELVARTSRL